MNRDLYREISAWLDNESDDQAAIEALIVEDPAVAARLAEYKKMGDAIRDLPTPLVTSAFTDRVLQAVSATESRAETKAAPRRWAMPLAVAAALVLGFAFVLRYAPESQPATSPAPQAQGSGQMLEPRGEFAGTLLEPAPYEDEYDTAYAMNDPILDEVIHFLASPAWEDDHDMPFTAQEDLFALLDTLDAEEEAEFQVLLREYEEGSLIL